MSVYVDPKIYKKLLDLLDTYEIVFVNNIEHDSCTAGIAIKCMIARYLTITLKTSAIITRDIRDEFEDDEYRIIII